MSESVNTLHTTVFRRWQAILRPPNRRLRLGTAGAPLLLLAACNVGPGAEGSFGGSGNPSASASPTAGGDGPTGGGESPSATDDAGTTTGGSATAGTTTPASDPTTGESTVATDASEASTGDGASGSDDESSGGSTASDDAFDPLSCSGVPWTAADATGELGVASRLVLANATIQVRSRSCPGGACSPWSLGEDWTISYLTYSGGVTTRYKDVRADLQLVLYSVPGMPMLSLQHVTFAAGGYPDDDGVVYAFPPAPVQYPHLRAYNVMPGSASDYIDLDYQVSDGTLVLGQDCARWTATPFGAGQPDLQEFAVLFRW